jgi:hypothetical protein
MKGREPKMSNEQSARNLINQEPKITVFNEGERNITLSSITGKMDWEAIEALSELFICLLDEMQNEPLGAQHAQNELKLLLEGLFKQSAAYELAHELYVSRFRLFNSDVTVQGNDIVNMLMDIKEAKLTNRKESFSQPSIDEE